MRRLPAALGLLPLVLGAASALGSVATATAEARAVAEALTQEAPPVPALGTLRGHVEFLRAQPVPDRRPTISDLGMPAHRDLPDQRVAVVYLESAPRGAFEERPGPTAVLDQKNETFVPHVLAITTGTSVEFRNSDRTYHNVFSLSKANSFDLGRYPPGRSKAVRFDHPGIVRVFCEIHSHMNAFILVFAHRHFALTNAQGEYRIEGIPPGNYTVSVWHPVLSGKSASIHIPEQGGEAVVDFALS
jgi:plastocyanin